jgi:probable metal-binding protein
MLAPFAIHGQEISDLVSAYPNGIRLSQLSEAVAKRFGSLAGFHTGSRVGLDLDALLVSLEARNKLRIVRGVVYPGGR